MRKYAQENGQRETISLKQLRKIGRGDTRVGGGLIKWFFLDENIDQAQRARMTSTETAIISHQ